MKDFFLKWRVLGAIYFYFSCLPLDFTTITFINCNIQLKFCIKAKNVFGAWYENCDSSKMFYKHERKYRSKILSHRLQALQYSQIYNLANFYLIENKI